jgi:hypothetical protein
MDFVGFAWTLTGFPLLNPIAHGSSFAVHHQSIPGHDRIVPAKRAARHCKVSAG